MALKESKQGFEDKINLKTKKEFVRVNGHLHEVTTMHHKGKEVHKIISPLMVEFHSRDLVQVMLGASLLAIPVGFTEETWRLGESLPMLNIFLIVLMSMMFISIFVYYNYYKHKHVLKKHKAEYFKRVIATYVVAIFVVGFILTVIKVAIWSPEMWLLSFKRIVLVSFPASMSAAVADYLK